jgi:hypothetical protein
MRYVTVDQLEGSQALHSITPSLAQVEISQRHPNCSSNPSRPSRHDSIAAAASSTAGCGGCRTLDWLLQHCW